MRGDRRADIGEGVAPADRAGRHPGPKARIGRVLAGVVRAAPAWVVAVIGGDDGEIAGLQRGIDLGDPAVERFEAAA